MNASLIPTIIISLFLVFVILGFMCGWVRGFSKSLVRFIIVLGVGVLSFFVIPPITEAVLTLDISKFNIIIGEVQVMTVQDLATDLLRQIPFVEDIIEASPTFETFLEIMPQMILNIVLFILLFFVFKWVSMLIYWIISGIFFNKKKMAGKEKHGFVGAVIGAIQGVLVACVVLVPCYGMVDTVKPFITATQSQEQTQTYQTFSDGVYYVDEQEGADLGEENSLAETINQVEVYVNAFENNWVSKMLNAIGIRKLSVEMFDYLTTIEDRNVEYSLRREIKTIAEAYPYIQSITETGFDIQDNEKLADLKDMIDVLYESPVLSGMVKEIIPEIADRWYNGFTFCEIGKPTVNDESIQNLLDLLLLNLSTSTGDTIKNDVVTTVDLLMIVNDAELLKAFAEDGNIMDVLSNPDNENLISDIISKALESDTLKVILPDVINVGMEFVYRALQIDPDTISDVNVESSDIDWDFEKPRLQTIFNNVFKIYSQIEEGKNNGQDALENLDFALLGSTFDNMRFSTLLGPTSKQIMKALLNSESIIGGDDETLQTFVTKLEEAWDSDELLAPTFESLGQALKLAKDMQTSVDDFDVENLEEIITNLTSNDILKDVVQEVVTTETLQNLGLDKPTADMVDETLSTILKTDFSEGSGNNLTTEIEAVKEIYSVANKVINLDQSDESNKVEVSAEESAVLIESLAESTVILDVITQPNSGVGNLNIGDNLSEESKNNIMTQIENIEDQSVKDKLNYLFGLIA